MQALDLAKPAGARCRILCIGSHADDIEIGCGGLLLSLIQRCTAVEIDWVVFSASGVRKREARRSAEMFLKGAHRKRIVIKSFPDGFFPYQGGEIKTVFEALKREVAPNLVLTHHRNDGHQDHRLLSDLTWNTFRDHLVLEYEVPKYDGDLGQPNCFVPLTKATCARKTQYLEAAFRTQRDKHWFSAETFMGLMRLRGIECRAPDGYAEAFYGRKLILGL
jgi:LmbE family N-acetylglucosaminyl deacetylase